MKLAKEIILPEKDWEVALSSITFPSTLSTVVRSDVNYELLLGTDFMCGMELDMKGMKDTTGSFITSKSFWLKGSEMKDEFIRGMLNPRDGVDFWNRMLALLNYRLHSRLPRRLHDYIVEDKDYQKKRPRWPVFHWEDVGGTYRLYRQK